ncbi:type IX secretion system plug protein [Lacinutrix jangbogonensis]|uniref:type IX secretion system plug protein n=1 Tax=Lacinutrix jangbogonensis TaxID=1469557 RepID=UPI00053EF538|nr:DUF5103 domain-containing protein [Lacinutrix jangbogonensis]
MAISIKQILLSLFITTSVFAQVEEINPPDYIKTITFKSQSSSQAELPIIKLNEPFYLEFDAIVENEPDFYYTIEHYNYDWTKSILAKAEFLLGLDNLRIINYRNSFNTFQLYSHYRLDLPNKQTQKIKLTGNYLITVRDEDDNIAFTRKFIIYEDLVTVNLDIKRSRNVSKIDKMQTVDMEISGALKFNNPSQTVNTTIIQNRNYNTAIKNLKPQYIVGDKLIYRYTDETAFLGGNEFLFFETRSPRAALNGVASTRLKDINNSYLRTDTSRANLDYTYNPDINGRFKITAVDADDVTVEADYINVHFSLNISELDKGERIFVYGNYNNYALEDNNELIFDEESANYITTLKLKQGFYNYQYVILKKDGSLDHGSVSGDFWQTENNYKVIVYYRDLGARYDRVVGFSEISSTSITN